MRKMQKGDIVVLENNRNMNAPVGSLAIVQGPAYGNAIQLHWLSPVGNQMHGTYNSEKFRYANSKEAQAAFRFMQEELDKAKNWKSPEEEIKVGDRVKPDLRHGGEESWRGTVLFIDGPSKYATVKWDHLRNRTNSWYIENLRKDCDCA